MITNEMIAAGAKVVGGIIDGISSLLSKIGSKKREANQAIKDEATAVENILKKRTELFAKAFNLVTTGTSKNPYEYILSLYNYMLNNPIVYDDKKDKISGLKKYDILFKESGNNVIIELVLFGVPKGTENIIMSKQFDKRAKIFTEGNIILPLVYAYAESEKVISKDLYNKAIMYNSGKSGLSFEDIEKWKSGKTQQTTNNANIDTNSNQNLTEAANSGANKTKYIIGFSALAIMIGVAIAVVKGKK